MGTNYHRPPYVLMGVCHLFTILWFLGFLVCIAIGVMLITGDLIIVGLREFDKLVAYYFFGLAVFSFSSALIFATFDKILSLLAKIRNEIGT